MTRIEDAIKEGMIENRTSHLDLRKCQDCGEKATIWIRRGLKEDLVLCNRCAFHLARILLQDIGHDAVKSESSVVKKEQRLRSTMRRVI